MQLSKHLQKNTSVVFLEFKDAERDIRLQDCKAIFVHYEASLVPDKNFLKRLNLLFPKRIFVIPHEVYNENPFAFPYKKLKNLFWLDLVLRRALYKWRHRDYTQEKTLQSRGYDTYRVIPLSHTNTDILNTTGATNLLEPVPLAFAPHIQDNHNKSSLSKEVATFNQGNQNKIKCGIFGFLNQLNDYETVLDAMVKLGDKISLIITGGTRTQSNNTETLIHQINSRKLEQQVILTGYLDNITFQQYMDSCDLFICPFKARSNSSSLLRLIDLGKPVIVKAIGLSEELKKEGAPIYTYQSKKELYSLLNKAINNNLPTLQNRYKYTFQRVAEMYMERISLNIQRNTKE
ncbi:MAG: glycosyltransferase [Fibrobacteria bacterium]|nr:glycosyltransferase [Fibrobacteria bacterium]